ncbi:MAG: protein kinase [Granulosicoccaceae bacterium]
MESSTPYKTLQPGEMLNWYRIERILGRGGFGVIYLATDTNLDHLVAIKEYIPSDVATRSEDSHVHPITEDHNKLFRWGMDRFIKEARNLVKFKHPNIVRVMSVFQQNNTAYMVMEFEEGEELRSYLKRPDANSEHDLKALILPISQGLTEVHRHGFVHRDIKPANILVRKNGSPVLLDFGSARHASRYTQQQSMTALVSAGYAPLEQYNGESDEQQGPWTDIYALGGVLYYAISGSDPADSTRRGAAMLNDAQDPLVAAIKLGKGRYSEAFLSAIDWALRFKIADRPQTLADWMPALLGDKTVLDARQSNATWIENRGFRSEQVIQLDSETLREMSDATVLSRDRTPSVRGALQRSVPDSQQPRSISVRALAWLSLVLLIGASSIWLVQQRPDIVDGVVTSLYRGDGGKAAEAAAKLAAQQLADEEAARVAKAVALRAAERQEEAVRAEAARLMQAEEDAAAASLAEQQAEVERSELAARQAEEDAELERRRQETRLIRKLNRALTDARVSLTRGDLNDAQRQLDTAKGIGRSDRRIAKLETDLQTALEEYYKPVSDNDFDIVMRMFDALKRAIENKDISAVERLSKQSDQVQLFGALIKRFEKLEIEISGIKVRNAEKSISAQLTILSMVRSNGDRATPSDAYRNRTIRSKRVNGRWSVIDW